MSLAQDSPASPSVSQENSEDMQTKETCGLQPSSASKSSGLNTASLKMSLASSVPLASLENGIWMKPQMTIFGTSEPFSQTFPKHGMMRGGSLWERVMSGQTTGERGCGYFVPTPAARDWKSVGPADYNRHDPCLNAVVKRMWLTPRANETDEKAENFVKRNADRGMHCDGTLTAQVKRQWPTPTGTERSGINPNTGKGEGLSKTVKNWPTPCSRGDDKGGPVGLGGGQRAKEKLKEMVGREQQLQMSCGSLNPDWVEWLMGWPVGWTSLEPLTELVWLSWKIDPADMEESDMHCTPVVDDASANISERKPNQIRMLRRSATLLMRNGNNGPIPRVATGLKDRVNRLKALGNGQVPLCVSTAWKILSEGIADQKGQSTLEINNATNQEVTDGKDHLFHDLL